MRDFWKRIKLTDLPPSKMTELLIKKSVLVTLDGYRYRVSIPEKSPEALEDSDLIVERDPYE